MTDISLLRQQNIHQETNRCIYSQPHNPDHLPWAVLHLFKRGSTQMVMLHLTLAFTASHGNVTLHAATMWPVKCAHSWRITLHHERRIRTVSLMIIVAKEKMGAAVTYWGHDIMSQSTHRSISSQHYLKLSEFLQPKRYCKRCCFTTQDKWSGYRHQYGIQFA